MDSEQYQRDLKKFLEMPSRGPQVKPEKIKEPPKDPMQLAKGSLEEIRMDIHNLLFAGAKARRLMGYPGNDKEALGWIDIICWEHLKTRSQIFCVGGLGYILLNGREDKPIPVSKDGAAFSNLLFDDYGIHPGYTAKDHVGKFIGMRCDAEGIKTETRLLSHYDGETNIAYFAEAPGKMLRVTKDEITRVVNGTDRVLFLFPDDYDALEINLNDLDKFQYSLIAERDSLLENLLLCDLEFAPSNLTPEQILLLLTSYIVLLFLPNAVAGHLLLEMLGPTGSGKTYFLRAMGRIALGIKFDVVRMPSDPKEFENLLVNNALVALDNLSVVSDRTLHDLICQACTGLVVKRREYYTTMGQVEQTSKATLAISAKESPFGEEEIANRRMLFKLAMRETFKDEKELLEIIQVNRNNLMAELIVRVQMVLRALDATRGYDPNVQIRLASYATFLLRIARHEGWEPGAQQLLEVLKEEQTGAALADNALAEALFQWIASPKWEEEWAGKPMLAGELHKELAEIVGGDPAWKHPGALGRRLNGSMRVYQNRFGLTVSEDLHTRSKRYVFNPSPAKLAMLRKSASRAAEPGTQVRLYSDDQDE